MNAIEARDVRKVYRRYGRRRVFGTLKSALLSGRALGHLSGVPAARTVRGGVEEPEGVLEALRGVSFDVEAGKTLGVIGRNGSGKSTLLKLMAGIGKPSAGSIRVQGRVSALIELGAGFHPEISGRENVYINGMMLGLSKREIADRFDEVVAFAGLEDFIDAPVKTYSSGMYMRLGFAVATSVDPDVLLVDEVLAVGDESFAHKCFDKLAELKRRGRTVVLVTHSLELVTRFCDEALWIDEGQTGAQGDPKRVVDAYLLDVARVENEALAEGDAAARVPSETADRAEPAARVEPGPVDLSKTGEGRWGSREAEIVAVELRGDDGAPMHVFPSGARIEIHVKVHAHEPLRDFVFGVGIYAPDGTCCYGTNTQVEGAEPAELRGDADVTFTIDRLDLLDGTYKLDVAVHRQNGAPYDYHRLLHTFRVTSALKDVGIFRPPHRWSFSGGVRIGGLD